MLWFFLLFSTACWGLAEIFYKKGNPPEETCAHLKTTVFVGICFGIYALVILCTQDISLKDLPLNLLRYLPVAACYIVSMVCSYFGVRFIEESISDPIENTSGAFVPLLCALFMQQKLDKLTVVAIALVAVGILGVGLFDREGKERRKQSLGKKLAFLSIAMPCCYMLLDAAGTFLDIYYTDSAATSVLRGVTEENLEHTANCCYELTFFLVSVGILIYLKARRIPLLSGGPSSENIGTPLQRFAKGIRAQRYKLLAALFETAGQATYLFALSEGSGVAALILGAGTIILSFTLSAIVLKEKLSPLQYGFIALIFAGIVTVSFVG